MAIQRPSPQGRTAGREPRRGRRLKCVGIGGWARTVGRTEKQPLYIPSAAHRRTRGRARRPRHALAEHAFADDPDPVVRAASIVQEDLCVLEKLDSEWILTSACVCFPSRWSLASKIGTSMDVIHAPIPLYDSKLARPVNLFFDRLTPEKPVWRLNWSVLDTDELSLTDPAERRADSGVTSIDDLWFRVERQTLRRLPHSGAVIFTIRTYVDQLSAVLEGHPHRREALQVALDTIDSETAVYKGWGHFLDVLRADLVRH